MFATLSRLHVCDLFSVYELFLHYCTKWTDTPNAASLAFRNLVMLSEEPSPDSKTLMNKVVFSMWSVNSLQWRKNLKRLQDDFTHRRRTALMHPCMSTYLPLIYLRQVIVGMRDYANKITHDRFLNSSDEPIKREDPSVKSSGLPDLLVQITQDLDKLDKELHEEIHLIIGAVTVQDSDSTKQQAERATLLTLLAAIYLPLTLVTGIFGMNIKGIDEEGRLGWRACCVALAVVGVCTAGFVVAYRRWRKRRRARREKLSGFKYA